MNVVVVWSWHWNICSFAVINFCVSYSCFCFSAMKEEDWNIVSSTEQRLTLSPPTAAVMLVFDVPELCSHLLVSL